MNLVPEKRYRIEIGDPRRIAVILVGCGGTGSFAALHLARLAYEARRGGGPALDLAFVDPDTVEEKNIGRQNFCPAEIGQPKAVALATRYSLAFGLSILPGVQRFEGGNTRADLTLVIGCVDSPASRAQIAAAIGSERRGWWWLDAGNDEHSGQVLIGNGQKAVIDPTLGCVGLPWPSVQEPGLVQGSGGAGEQGRELSCAELLALNAQSLMINQAMGGWLATYAYRLLLGRDLDIYQTWLDLRSGSVRSVGITEGEVVGVGEAPVEEREIGLEGGAVGHCPQCNAYIFEGRDTLDEEIGEEETVFCPACGWQVYAEDWENMQAELVQA